MCKYIFMIISNIKNLILRKHCVVSFSLDENVYLHYSHSYTHSESVVIPLCSVQQVTVPNNVNKPAHIVPLKCDALIRRITLFISKKSLYSLFFTILPRTAFVSLSRNIIHSTVSITFGWILNKSSIAAVCTYLWKCKSTPHPLSDSSPLTGCLPRAYSAY